jgi:hypothetical protein
MALSQRSRNNQNQEYNQQKKRAPRRLRPEALSTFGD